MPGCGRREGRREAVKLKNKLETKKDQLESALAQRQRRVEELASDKRSREANELVAGAGAVLGALFGGRRSASSITSAVSGAASRRGVTSRVGDRQETAESKLDETKDDLAAIEQEIIDEVTQINDKWTRTAAEIESVSIRLEAADVRVVETRLVWVPVA